MLVMILEKAPASLRGVLSRWLIEPRTGVFLGMLSARVRDQLWTLAVTKCKEGSVLQVWSDHSPQGYQYRAFGPATRAMRDFEGIGLVRLPPKEKRGPKVKPEVRGDEPPPLIDNPIE